MKKTFILIVVAMLTILTSCEINKKQCYQFTTKVAGQTVTTYENCTKAVAEETIKQLKANGASSATYKVVDSSKCNGTSTNTTTPSTTTTPQTTPTTTKTSSNVCYKVSYYMRNTGWHEKICDSYSSAQSYANVVKKSSTYVNISRCDCK